MDNLIISVSLTLFMLSLITEKIANFSMLHVRSLADKAGDVVGERNKTQR